MFMKRAMYSWRNWKMVAAQFLVPLIFTAFALIVAKTFPGPRDSSMLRLTLEPYGQTIVPFSVPTASGLPQRLAEQYVELLDAQHQSPLEVPGEALQSTHVVLSAGFSCQGWVPSDIPYGIISCTGGVPRLAPAPLPLGRAVFSVALCLWPPLGQGGPAGLALLGFSPVGLNHLPLPGVPL